MVVMSTKCLGFGESKVDVSGALASMVFVAPPVPRPMLHPAWSLPVAALLLLAGCSSPPAGAPSEAPPTGMQIIGIVQDEDFTPISGAQVALRLTNHSAVTDAGGLFTFRGLTLSPYLVDVHADGYLNATLTAEPKANVSLSFILVPPQVELPPPAVLHFTGKFVCAFEALIISPSCDTVIDIVREHPQAPPGVPDVFEDISTFDFPLGSRWSTVIVDVDFAEHPGLDGLRLTIQGKNDDDQLASYEKYGSFHDSDPFSARIEPGQEYPEGGRPVPTNATSLQIEVYPHGHGWHALCTDPVPPALGPGMCPLGAGAARDVQFDLYVTIFFVEPAPADYSLLA